MPSSILSIPVSIGCSDGYELQGTLWQDGGLPIAAVLIHPATGVPEALYAAFAQYLAGRGLAALTYDYRGIGRSRPARLRGFRARMRDWADLDVEAVTDWMRERFAPQPLLAVGHSFGGHAIGLAQGSRHLKAAALIASHAGSLRLIESRGERLRVTALLRLIGPLLSGICGYMPGRKLGLGEDLPADLLREWGGWTAMPRYFFDDPTLHAAERFARQALPVLAVGFDDDPWASHTAIDLLVGHLVHCDVQRLQIGPGEGGGGAIGHMGFFRRRHGDLLWPRVVDRLLAAAGLATNSDADAPANALPSTPESAPVAVQPMVQRTAPQLEARAP
jgi:predicted alpha/beta hydrolase